MLKFDVTIRNGNLKLPDARFQKYCHGLKDGEYQLEIKRHKKSRSLNQNRYYWKVIVNTVAEFQGEDDPEESHGNLKYLFLKVYDESGNIKRIKSTTELSTVEAEDYYAKIRRFFMIEYNVNIPEPNETIYDY